ncbi:MAG: phospholipase [Micavibrio sp.]|nr:phospholipase [Micavibrio sp.]|tara:strand:- start:268 stop:927 length:660 start_codon:yes stop_codon:yes gene_type:complete
MSKNEISNIYDFGPTSKQKPQSLVILLHGLGSNGRDLISLAPLWAKELPDTVFVSPDAPFACDMVPPGYPDSYQWFSLQNRDSHIVKRGVETAAPILQGFIEQQAQHYGLEPSKVALVGFSQGTMMSLYTAPRYAKGALAGVLGFSGALVGEPGATKMPVCLIHGEADDVVPISAYHHAKGELQAAGYQISGHTTAGLTHSIDEKGILEGAKFLKEILY